MTTPAEGLPAGGGRPVLNLLQGEVGGVPTFWIPGDGRLSVALLFGVGVRDESLVVRGINHLVEHLTLFGLDHRAIDFNGHVTATATAFTASGSVDEVQHFLDHVSASLRSLPLDRLEHERRVLRTEARSRGRTLNGLHLDHRFGPNGVGLLEAEELGLRWLGGDQLRPWIDTWFNGANAALAVSGPDPRQLRLDLPSGVRPGRAPVPAELIDRPTWTPTPGNVVALSTTAPRSTSWMVSMSVITEVVEHRLRQVDARTYSVVDVALPLDHRRAVFYLGADCLDEEAGAVRDAMSFELARLRTRGPSPEELTSAASSILRGYSDERAALGAVYSAADNHLLGKPPTNLTQVAAEVAAVTGAEVAATVDEALGRLLWTVPFGSPIGDRRFADLPYWSADQVEGTTYLPGDRQDTSRVDDRLVVGPDGVSHLRSGKPVTVRWSEAVACCRFDDRCWTLHGADGFVLTVRARDWVRGGDAVADVSLMAPRGTVVEMGEELAPGEPDVDPTAALAPGPSAAAWSAPHRPAQGLSGPPAPPAAAGGGPSPTSSRHDSSTWGAVAIVWVFAGAIALWVLSTMGDGSGNRARLRVALLVLAGAGYATRVLLKR